MCEPAQAIRAWTFHKSHFVWKFTGKMAADASGDIVLREPAQSKCTWTEYKSHFAWKFTGKTTGTPLGTSFCASLRSRNAHGHFTNALLDEGEFKASVVGTFRVEGNGSPDIQVVMLLPVAKSHFSLYKSFVVELKIFSGTTVLPVKSVVHGGPNIKLGLRVHDMSETNVNTLGLEKWFGEEVVSVEC